MKNNVRQFSQVRLTTRTALTIAGLSVAVLSVFTAAQPGGPGVYARAQRPATATGVSQSQRYEQEGVVVEFSVDRAGGQQLLDADEATIRFKISDASTRKPLSNLRPAAWMDRRDAGAISGARQCREKVQAFLQSSFSRQPSVNLNSYFMLALNNEPNISVIDPLSGFGRTKLLTLIPLASPGEDWVMNSKGQRLYVSVPLSNHVAVIDLATFKVVAAIDAGANPSRLALQNDEKYLWVGNDAANEADSGVSVIDTTTLKVAARIKTGMGHHEILITPNDRTAFVTNKESATVSAIDVRTLTRVKDLKVGPLPVSIAFSPLSQSVYVGSQGDGTISAIGGGRLETLAKLMTAPGLRTVRVSPDGRYGFAVSQTSNAAYIFDLSTQRLVHTVPVESKPDQIIFTQQFAYIRAQASAFVTMINLAALGREAAITRFPAGQKTPLDSRYTALAAAMVPSAETGSVLVANAADKMIYFYTEGMAAPMGSFQNYRREPRALLVLNKSLRETEPGVYSTSVQLPAAGEYDVALLLDSPRLVNCFGLSVAENPDKPKAEVLPIHVEMVPGAGAPRVGQPFKVRFKVTDTRTQQLRTDLKDMGVLVFLAPGIWQQREWAKPLGDGTYEMTFVPPQPGVYYVHFRSPSLNVTFSKLPSTTLTVPEDD